MAFAKSLCSIKKLSTFWIQNSLLSLCLVGLKFSQMRAFWTTLCICVPYMYVFFSLCVYITYLHRCVPICVKANGQNLFSIALNLYFWEGGDQGLSLIKLDKLQTHQRASEVLPSPCSSPDPYAGDPCKVTVLGFLHWFWEPNLNSIVTLWVGPSVISLFSSSLLSFLSLLLLFLNFPPTMCSLK